MNQLQLVLQLCKVINFSHSFCTQTSLAMWGGARGAASLQTRLGPTYLLGSSGGVSVPSKESLGVKMGLTERERQSPSQ